MKFTPFAWSKTVYASLLELIEFAVSQLADSAVTVALRVAPIVAPIPNSIGVFNLTYTGDNLIQSLMFAASIEIMMFVMVDRCVSMLDGFLSGSKSHKRMMALTAAITLLLWAIVTVLVYKLESSAGGNAIMAAMPTFSLFAAFALGVGKWDAAYRKHDEAQKTAKAEIDRAELERSQIEAERKAKLENEERARLQQIEDEERKRRQQIEDEERKARLEAEAKRVQAQLEVERIKAEADAQAKLNRSANRSTNRSTVDANLNGSAGDLTVNTVQQDGSTSENKRLVERRKKILLQYRDNPAAGMGEVAKAVGTSKATVSNDINWLLNAGIIHVSDAGSGKPKTVTLNGGSEEFLSSK